MYVLIDWMTFGFVIKEGTDSIQTWETIDEAEKYGEQELQSGLWKVVSVPPFAWPFKP